MRIDELASPIFYHGTSSTVRAKSILKTGIKAQTDEVMGRKARAALTPVQGHSYLTPSIKYACVYALCANVVGMDYKPRKGEDRYGYVFVVNGSDLALQPDEDEVGFAVREATAIIKHYAEKAGEPFHTRHMDNLVFGQALCDNLDVARRLKYLADSYLTVNQKKRMWHDYEYAILAQAGKKLLKVMPPDLKQKLVEMGCHVSTPDVVVPKEAWRLDKTKSNELGYQGENFFKVAKRIF